MRTMPHEKSEICVLPHHWERIEDWCEKLGIPYAGQGLPAISFQVLQHLMKELNVRESLSGEEKCAIHESFDHRCAFCGSRAKRMEFDHIVRHSESFGAAPECQVLCQPCHQLKTSNEARNLEGTLFSS